MYFDFRLWEFTKGVRLRIAGSAAIGLLAAVFGIARLALLGWLLAKVFRAEPLDSLIVPFAIVATVMLTRGYLEYARNMAVSRRLAEHPASATMSAAKTAKLKPDETPDGCAVYLFMCSFYR